MSADGFHFHSPLVGTVSKGGFEKKGVLRIVFGSLVLIDDIGFSTGGMGDGEEVDIKVELQEVKDLAFPVTCLVPDNA